MSRFIRGDCVRVMATIPGNGVDFILTDPPYLVGFRDRQGRTIAGDKTDEWLQPACNEMYRVLKKDALMVSFYGWNRVDRFMAARKNAGFSVVGHRCLPKPTLRRPHMWAIATNALTSRQRASGAASEAIARRAGLEIFRQSSSPDGKACYQPATTD